jgi:hypothetical protein
MGTAGLGKAPHPQHGLLSPRRSVLQFVDDQLVASRQEVTEDSVVGQTDFQGQLLHHR